MYIYFLRYLSILEKWIMRLVLTEAATFCNFISSSMPEYMSWSLLFVNTKVVQGVKTGF